ncbi:hypothetical protein Glove_283g143 [Diversispora epigaea]|uniref:Uncharacterized protein n=1 Tax=Diversispora epigaea TaxID=1348612 RepID=A0A397I9R1_9GLOM|nr:hypothetical protein Glove_283g143 [Diversispora epigaea]
MTFKFSDRNIFAACVGFPHFLGREDKVEIACVGFPHFLGREDKVEIVQKESVSVLNQSALVVNFSKEPVP